MISAQKRLPAALPRCALSTGRLAGVWRAFPTHPCVPRLAGSIWKLLLGIYPPDATEERRLSIDSANRERYAELKQKWQQKPVSQSEELRATIRTIVKDVMRTDRDFVYFKGDDNPHLAQLLEILTTYSVFENGVGYTQGMSDLLSPLMAVIKDEAMVCSRPAPPRCLRFPSHRGSAPPTALELGPTLLRDLFAP